jgi:hypothetical protein
MDYMKHTHTAEDYAVDPTRTSKPFLLNLIRRPILISILELNKQCSEMFSITLPKHVVNKY